jgi:Fe-S cluster assembly iron-binding protein IscA
VGMALDEPKEDDEKIEQSGMTFVMAPDVVGAAKQSGGVSIDYVDDGYRKGYMINLGAGGDCGSCSDSGGCG